MTTPTTTMPASRLGTLAALALAALACMAALPAPAAAHTYTYDFEIRTSMGADPDEFSILARQTMNSRRGWSLTRHNRFNTTTRNPDFTLVLASPAVVERAAPLCDRTWSCRVGDRIYINEARWLYGTSTWPGNMRTYRQYAINHEVGHWFDLGHRSCPGANRVAPVMMQQSKGYEPCRANVWPLDGEKHTMARIQEIDWDPHVTYHLDGYIGNPTNLRWRNRYGNVADADESQLWPELARASREARAEGRFRIAPVRGGLLYWVNPQGNFERVA